MNSRAKAIYRLFVKALEQATQNPERVAVVEIRPVPSKRIFNEAMEMFYADKATANLRKIRQDGCSYTVELYSA